jgi:poly(beta-D-mannuronate) lyase
MIKVVSKRPVLLFILVMSITEAMATLVYNQTELTAAIKTAKPGDSILLSSTANWQNTNIVFEANGTIDKPIVLAGYPNAVALSKNSSLAIGGNYLVVSNLHFVNGYAKERATIEFRTKNNLANNCRVTFCKIDNYSKPIRFDIDSWIVFWGKNNRFDHNYIGDKLNAGTTLIVELNDERSQQNFHSVDSNYFAGRSRLGSNGGETIRIGVSRYSMTSSNTSIKDNLFYHNSGEVEIISVKSCNNQILNNTFYECEGNVVLRHGQGTTVANNIFIGNGKPYTGGVRVIDSGHTVKNNLFVGLTGNRFRSALAVMNAVPNSLPNRYLQVKDANISNNLFLNCSNIIFGSGKDVERTLAPTKVSFANNTVAGTNTISLVDNNKDGGIQYANNFTNNAGVKQAGFVAKMFSVIPSSFETSNNLSKLQTFVEKEFGNNINTKQLHWLQLPPNLEEPTVQVVNNKTFSPNQLPELYSFLAQANNVRNITLQQGTYALTKEFVIAKHTTIQAAGTVTFINATDKSLPSFFTIAEGCVLNIQGITFEANTKDAGDVQAAITTPKEGLLQHYKLNITNCTFQNFNEAGYNPIRGTKNSYADYIKISNCTFKSNAGVCIDFGAEKDDKGIYGVEELVVENCVFTNNLGPAINVYRGGNDESTTGPSITINHCVFNNVDNREQSYVLRLIGAQYARVTNSIFNNSGAGGRSIWFEEYSWDDVQVNHCNFYQSGRVQNFHGKLLGKQNQQVKPQFINSNNFFLQPSSLLKGKGSDGKDIGLVK